MFTWNQISDELARTGPNAVARVPVHQMEHPRDAGLTQTFGMPYGQRASYRTRLPHGATLCVEDFGTIYEARLEQIPLTRPAEAANEAAGTVLGLTALGALLGLALGGRKEAALTGALLGGVSGLATVAISEADRSPAKSAAAIDLTKAIASLLPAAAASAMGCPSAPTGRRGSERPHQRRKSPTE